MHIPYRIIFAHHHLDYMEKTPRCFICKERVLSSPVLLPDSVTLKISTKGWVPKQEYATRDPVQSPSFQNIILFNLCLSCSKGLLQTYEQDLLSNWSNGYRKHAFNAKFGGIRQHISYGRLNWVKLSLKHSATRLKVKDSKRVFIIVAACKYVIALFAFQ